MYLPPFILFFDSATPPLQPTIDGRVYCLAWVRVGLKGISRVKDSGRVKGYFESQAHVSVPSIEDSGKVEGSQDSHAPFYSLLFCRLFLL